MNTKNRILTGITLLIATTGLLVLTSSTPDSSTRTEEKVPPPACSKTKGKECTQINSNGEFIHESLSRQFILISPVIF